MVVLTLSNDHLSSHAPTHSLRPVQLRSSPFPLRWLARSVIIVRELNPSSSDVVQNEISNTFSLDRLCQSCIKVVEYTIKQFQSLMASSRSYLSCSRKSFLQPQARTFSNQNPAFVKASPIQYLFYGAVIGVIATTSFALQANLRGSTLLMEPHLIGNSSDTTSTPRYADILTQLKVLSFHR